MILLPGNISDKHHNRAPVEIFQKETNSVRNLSAHFQIEFESSLMNATATDVRERELCNYGIVFKGKTIKGVFSCSFAQKILRIVTCIVQF
jgi:hypothetical protein